MAQGDSKRIIRQWEREIEDELRLDAARNAIRRPWTAVVWGALWMLWLALLVSLITHTKLG